MAREIVICAAIRCEDGTIIRGHRHGDCFRSFKAEALRKQGVNVRGAEQGFITSKNRFVDRIEGFRLQLRAGIRSADPEGYRSTLLFSEDLY